MEKDLNIILKQLEQLLTRVENIETIIEGLEAILIGEATQNCNGEGVTPQDCKQDYKLCEPGTLCRNVCCNNFGKIV